MSAKATGKVSAAVMASRDSRIAPRNDLCRALRRQQVDGLFLSGIQGPQPAAGLCSPKAHSRRPSSRRFPRSLKTEGDAPAWALANKMMTLAAVFMSLVTLLGILAAPWVVDFLTSLSRSGNSPRTYNPEEVALTDHDGARDVSLHPASLTRGAGDGHAQCEECLRHAGPVVVFFQPRLDDRRRGARLVDGSHMGAAQFGRVFHRRGHRRACTTRLPVSSAAGGSVTGSRRISNGRIPVSGRSCRLMGPAVIAASVVQVNVVDQRDVRLRCR
jgi:hypothetical protein